MAGQDDKGRGRARGGDDLETPIMKAIELAIGSRRDARIWRNNRGTAFRGTRAVEFGIDGQADLSGVLKPSGRRLEIEVKRPGEGPNPDQIAFGKMIRESGGAWACVSSVEEAIAVVDRFQRQAWTGSYWVDPPAVAGPATSRRMREDCPEPCEGLDPHCSWCFPAR